VTSRLSHATRYEISVGGRPRTYCDLRVIALQTAKDIKSRNRGVEVTVRDLDGDEVILIDDFLLAVRNSA
jgi:hypothetical protein